MFEGIQDTGAAPVSSTKRFHMSCCNRKRTMKDFLYLPMAVTLTLVGFCGLLGIEMTIAYSLGYVTF